MGGLNANEYEYFDLNFRSTYGQLRSLSTRLTESVSIQKHKQRLSSISTTKNAKNSPVEDSDNTKNIAKIPRAVLGVCV